MVESIIYALGACALWGLVFAIPGVLEGFSAIEIALGRCLAFGLFSLSVYGLNYKCMSSYTFSKYGKTALLLTLVVSLIHYVALVIGLNYDRMLATLILGINPVTIAWYGSYRQNLQPLKYLILPSMLIMVGLCFVHINVFDQSNSLHAHFLGILFAAIGLATWTWFIVSNAEFLHSNSSMPVQDWVTLMGLATLFWALFCIICLFLLYGIGYDLNFTPMLNPMGWEYFIGSLMMGIGSSWVAQYFWNTATLRLPIALTGHLSVFETLFGLLFIYLIEMRMPNLTDATGILVILIGVSVAVYSQGNHNPLIFNE